MKKDLIELRSFSEKMFLKETKFRYLAFYRARMYCNRGLDNDPIYKAYRKLLKTKRGSAEFWRLIYIDLLIVSYEKG